MKILKILNEGSDTIEKMLYIFLFIYFFFSAIDLTMYSEIKIMDNISKVARYISYLGFVSIILINLNNEKNVSFKNCILNTLTYLKNHIILFFLIITSFIILIVAKNKNPLVLVLIVWATSYYNFEKSINYYFKVMIIFIFFTWGSCLLKIIPDIVKTRHDVMRYSLGYIYPLETMSHFLFIVLSYIYMRKENFDLKDLSTINLLNILLYKITDSRSSFLLIMIITLFIFVYYKTTFLKKCLSYIKKEYCYIFLIICIVVPLICIALYDSNNELWVIADKFVNGRIKLANDAFSNYGISLFGTKISWVGFGKSNYATFSSSYNFVDCSYAKNILDFGIVFSLLCFIGYAYIYKYAIENKNYLLIILITIVIILSIMEPRLLQISMNPFVLLLSHFFLLSNDDIKYLNIS